MSDVVKKGVLDVKRKNLIVASSYKKRFIVLRNSSTARGKVVEIWETENSEKDPERQPLGDSWSVQDKPSTSSKRYAFQLVIGEEIAFTFGCASFMEREEWTKAFNVFKKMAPPIGGQITPTDNDFFVKLISCPSGPEFSHPPGQYLLSVETNAICLHWRTGAIAHQWPRKYVQELSIRSWNIVLRVSRIGSGPSNTVEFEFQATRATAIAILKCWNMVLMESIVGSSKDPEQMSYIGKLLSAEASETTSKKSKSFRSRSQSTKVRRSPHSKSFSSSRSATVSRHPSVPSGKLFSEASAKKLSSELSVNGSLGISKQSTPPPLPPRPEHYGLSSDEDDPDYAYIEDSEIEGPKNASTSSKKTGNKEGGKRVASPSVDEQLLDIFLSMKQEKKEKRKKEAEEKRRAATVAYRPTHSQRPALSLGPQISFAPADPEDYLEPLVATFQTSRPKSTGDYETPVPIHKRSCSEPDTSIPYPHKCLSQPSLCLSQRTPPKLSPNDDSCPTLPPRSWQRMGSDELPTINKSSITAQKGDPNISPYATVRQILPSKIMEEESMAGDGREEKTLTQPPLAAATHPTDLTASSPTSSKITQGACCTPEATPPPQIPSSSGEADPVEPPPLPPRSPIKEKFSCGSSSSSSTSAHSHPHSPSSRCSRCQRRARHSVEKTLSDHRKLPSSPSTVGSPANQQGSLPDLKMATVVPENSLRWSRRIQRAQQSTESHSSSGGSSSSLQSPRDSGYLEVVADSSSMSTKGAGPSKPEDELLPDLKMLDEFMQYFDSQCASLPHTEGIKPSQPPPSQQHQQEQQQRAVLTQNPFSSPSLSSHTMQHPAPFSAHVSNGHIISCKVNGTKSPASFQRSYTVGAHVGSSPPPPSSSSSHPMYPIKSMSFTEHTTSAPPVPPRSDISLIQQARGPYPPSPAPLAQARVWTRTLSSGSHSSLASPTTVSHGHHSPGGYGQQGRLSSSGSIHSGSPSPTIGPHPRSFRNLASHFSPSTEVQGPSTVFIHHLKQDRQRRTMHSHMLHSHV